MKMVVPENALGILPFLDRRKNQNSQKVDSRGRLQGITVDIENLMLPGSFYFSKLNPKVKNEPVFSMYNLPENFISV